MHIQYAIPDRKLTKVGFHVVNTAFRKQTSWLRLCSSLLLFLFVPPWNWQGARRNPAKVRATPLSPATPLRAPLLRANTSSTSQSVWPMGHGHTHMHLNYSLLSRSQVVQSGNNISPCKTNSITLSSTKVLPMFMVTIWKRINNSGRLRQLY